LSIDTEKISELLPHQEQLPHTRLSLTISSKFQSLASALSWVWIVLLGVIVLNVTMRYVFDEGRIEFE